MTEIKTVTTDEYEELNDPTSTVREQDGEDWAKYDDARYARKRIEIPDEWEEDAEEFIVELFVGDERGGSIIIWKDGESNLTHIWPETSFEGQTYHKVDSQHCWDGDNIVPIFYCIKTASDVVSVQAANTLSDLIDLTHRENVEL